MSSTIRMILLVSGLIFFVAGMTALFSSFKEPVPLTVPVDKNEGRLVAAIVPVPKTSITPTPTPTASPDESPTPTPTPTATPDETPTPRLTPTPTPDLSPTPGFSPSPRPTRSPRPTPTPRPTPVIDPTPKPTPRFSPRPTPTFSPRPTPRPTPRHTPTPKPTPRRTPIIGITGRPPITVVEPTPKPPVILKQTPKPTPTPVVIGELREDADKNVVPGFWESVSNFFGYISPAASAAEAAPVSGGERETIDLTYPTELTAKGSGIIELKITRAATAPAGTPSGAANDGSSSTSDSGIELETDRCPPGSALSACLPDHETRAVVSLVGSGFEITSDGAQNSPKKIGPGSSPVWRWSIRPKGDVEGAQEMFVTLNFTWVKGAETLGPDASRPKDFKISVVKSFFEWGTISIAGLILSLIGPILTIPWFFERGKDLMRYYRERNVRKEVERSE